MMPRLFLYPDAKADAREGFAWYEERSTGLGFEDIRRTRLRRFPYSVFYVAMDEATVVIAVMHDRRDPRRWQARR